MLLGAACALAGCGVTQRDEVHAKVEQFAHATASRDYQALCQQVLAPSLVQRLADAGVTCQQAMKVFLQSVQNPTLSIARITIKGKTAAALVLSSATGQQAALASVALIDTPHGWRLTSLVSPR